MKRKILPVLLSICILLSFAGCNLVNSDDSNFKITASFSPVYALILAITNGADSVSVNCMSQITSGCLHDYQLTPNDMKTALDCNVFIINGQGIEDSFIDTLTMQKPDINIVNSSVNSPFILEDHDDTHEKNSEGDDHDSINPHTWLSLKNACVAARNIADALIAANPKNAEIYEKNVLSFVEEADRLYDIYQKKFSNLSSKRVILFHESVKYLTDEFGIETAAIISADDGTAPNPQKLNSVLKLINTGVTAVFSEPQANTSITDTIKSDSGVNVHMLDSLVTGKQSHNSYLTAMRNNLEIIFSVISV